MPSGEHTHVMNAHQPNPRAGLKKDDGSAEPSHIPHAEPARASQEDYRCIFCGKTHDELIPANDPSRKGGPAATISTATAAPSRKTQRKSSSKKSSRTVDRRPQGEKEAAKAPDRSTS